METITVSTRNHETFSAVSNFFIDYYMTDANGEFVKVYLYLVRLLNSGRALTISEIADHFNLTQKDICRAIKYWIKQGVLQLEYNSDNELTGITLLPLEARTAEKEEESILSMLGVEPAKKKKTKKDSSKELEPANDNPMKEVAVAKEIADSSSVPKKVSYKPSFIEEKKNDEDFGNLLYQTEIYFAASDPVGYQFVAIHI